MTSDVVHIGPDATAADAAALLRNRGLSSLVVLEDGAVCGILTVNDLLALLEQVAPETSVAPAAGGER